MQGTTSRSKSYTGNHEFPHDPNRQYLMILVQVGETTIEFGNGGGKIPVVDRIEPHRVPISAFRVETTGSFILVTEEETHNAAKAL